MKTQTFRVTRVFTAGILAGITYTETSRVQMPVGFTCEKPSAGDPYKVTACEPIPDVPGLCGGSAH